MITFRSWLRLEVLFSSQACLILLAAPPSFMIFPLNYGWWQVWADMEAQGLTLYEDTKLVFPPLFHQMDWLCSVHESYTPVQPGGRGNCAVYFAGSLTLLLQRFFSVFAALLAAH